MSRELFQELRTHLMERLDLARELSDEEILDEIDDLILGRMREYGLSLKEKVQLRQELFHSVRKLDVLQELIEDETVTEIMVNGPDLAAMIAASFRRFSRSAPVNPAVVCAICARFTSSPSGLSFAWTLRISSLPFTSGLPTATLRSKRPGRRIAGSRISTRLVAAITMIPSLTPNPSISTRS